VVNYLFGDADPLGATVRINKCPFTVIGVLMPRGQSFDGTDQDDQIEAPIRTVQLYLLHHKWIHYLIAAAQSGRCMGAAQDEMTELLRCRHGIMTGAEDDFVIRNMTDIASAAHGSSRTFALLLASIASVSLLVGGIGVMNIMLVSVTERTREIGTRMAFGARGRDVLLQFLIEAVVLSLSGGGLGILLGVGATSVIRTLTKWPVLLDPGAILLALSFSAAVGIFFGFYPARRASRMEPIDALRYE
jgi:putative ABC transport system permease protein